MIGLWQAVGDRTATDNDEVTGAGMHSGVRSLLLTRRPNLAMWERSKLPEGRTRIESARHAQPPLRPVRLDRRLHSDASDCGR